MKKCPSSLRCWESNSQPSDYESPPLTTRPGTWKVILRKGLSSKFFISAPRPPHPLRTILATFNDRPFLVNRAINSKKKFASSSFCVEFYSNFRSNCVKWSVRVLGSQWKSQRRQRRWYISAHIHRMVHAYFRCWEEWLDSADIIFFSEMKSGQIVG